MASVRVLIADDNIDNADMLVALLRLHGYDAEAVYDGIQATERASPIFDVVILDINMPGLNGYEIARAIRNQPWGRDVLLLAYTGWDQDPNRTNAQLSEFDQHLTKPGDLDVLLKQVARAASKKRAA
jgi:CheY-like chemotaxis protein